MDNTQLYHFGIKGQKWGVRRFQNSDGSLTSTGRRKLGQRKDGTLTKRGRLNVAKNQYANEKGYSKPKAGVRIKRAKIGSKEHMDMIKGRLTNKKSRDIGKISEGIRKSQNAEKKANRTPKQTARIKKAKIAVGVVGGLIAADYISAKVSGQPTVTEAVSLLIKTSTFGG